MIETCGEYQIVRDDGRTTFQKPPRVIPYSQVARRPIEWLWPGRIAVGKLTFLVGEPGLGKGMLTADLAARISRGACWPDNPEQLAPQGSVIMLHAEDDEQDTMPDRLQAAGADLDKVFTFQQQSDLLGVSVTKPFSLRDGIDQLGHVLAENPDCRLIVIDPITAYLGTASDTSNAEIRSLLYRLANLAKRFRVAVVVVAHLNKQASASSINRVMGALSFVSTARTVWGVMRDPADENQRLMLSLKNNVAEDNQGLSFRLLKNDGEPVPHVDWSEKPINMTFQSACVRGARFNVAEQEYRDEEDHVTKRLREELSSGPRERFTLKITVPGREGAHYRAADRLGVIKVKGSFSEGWIWMLPEHFPKWEAEQAEKQHQQQEERQRRHNERVNKQRNQKKQADAGKASKSDPRHAPGTNEPSAVSKESPAMESSSAASGPANDAGQDDLSKPFEEKDLPPGAEISPAMRMYLAARMPGVPPVKARELMRQQLQGTIDRAMLKKLNNQFQAAREQTPTDATPISAAVDPRKQAKWREQTRHMSPAAREAALAALQKIDEQKQASGASRSPPVSSE